MEHVVRSMTHFPYVGIGAWSLFRARHCLYRAYSGLPDYSLANAMPTRLHRRDVFGV